MQYKMLSYITFIVVSFILQEAGMWEGSVVRVEVGGGGQWEAVGVRGEGERKKATLSSGSLDHPSLATSEMYFNPLPRARQLHETWKMILTYTYTYKTRT